jgi:hypothetical protein
MQNIVMLSGIYAECYIQALSAECRYAECRSTICLCQETLKFNKEKNIFVFQKSESTISFVHFAVGDKQKKLLCSIIFLINYV